MKEQSQVPQIPEEIKACAVKLEDENKCFKNMQKLHEERKEKLTSRIIEFLDKSKQKGFVFNSKGYTLDKSTDISVLKKQATKIIYDAEKIEEKLGGKSKGFIDREYVINDYSGLVKYLKSCGVNPKIFKNYVSCYKTVNKDKLEQMHQLGEIEAEDLDGCYRIEKSKPYLEVKAVNFKER